MSHDLQRTGAPLVLLHYARWLVQEGHVVRALALDGGELDGAFAAVAPLFRLPSPLRRLHRTNAGPSGRLLEQLAFRRWLAKLSSNIDVAHVNTVASAWIIPHFTGRGIPVVAHIHELSHWIEHRTPPDNLRRLARSSAIICPSQRAQRELVQHLGLKSSLVHVVPEPVPRRERVPIDRESLRRNAGVSPDTFLIGGCGTTDWRKGPDLFLQVALELIARRGLRHIAFVWIGGSAKSVEVAQLRHDVRAMGLEGSVSFPGSLEDPLGSGWYDMLDAFALTSREDPFPLVMQEAAEARVPIVGFSGSGGAEEFIVSGETGELVGYADCHAMSDVLEDWANNRTRARELGEAGCRRRATVYDPSTLAAQVLELDRQASRNTNP